MRVLLVHADDDPVESVQQSGRWDRVVDLAGTSSGSGVEHIPKLDSADFERIRNALAFGSGLLIDSYGLDWWQVFSTRWIDELDQLLILKKFLGAVDERDEIFLSSPARYGPLLHTLAPGRVQVIETARQGVTRRRLASLVNLRLTQTLEILGDKYDGAYRLRRFFAPQKVRSIRPLVLLPSGYGNASRVALAYAAVLPEIRFLLVVTRQSGWVPHPPDNANCIRLASYAAARRNESEFRDLLASWRRLRDSFDHEPHLALLRELGCFDPVPAYLREGLAVRDCWRNVFATEPVASVLSADEKNPYTRIPVMLAKQKRIPTAACHHGALDGRYLFTDVAADRILAKGRMEWDYLVRVCGIDEQKVSLAGPAPARQEFSRPANPCGNIVFFSEPYEAQSLRARHVYAEVLPRLAALAQAQKCELVVKLHPFESVRDRKRLVRSVVPPPLNEYIRVVAGPLTDNFMSGVWFGITVSSTTAVDCAQRGVPAFLCRWLDGSRYGYTDQFLKFHTAMPLECAQDIANIPNLLKKAPQLSAQGLWEPVQPSRLAALLAGKAEGLSSEAPIASREQMWA